MVSQAKSLIGSTWGDVVSFAGTSSVQLLGGTQSPADPAALDSLYNFDALLQYVVGIYGSQDPTTSATPSLPIVATQGEVTLYNAHGSVPLNPSYPTFVIVD